MRAFLRVLLLAVAPVLVVVVPGAAPSHACSCAAASFEEQVESADAVFTGIALEEASLDNGSFGYRVSVMRVYSGDVQEVVRVVSSNQASACGTSAPQGARWLFTAEASERGEFRISSCDASTRLSAIDLADVETVTGPAGPPQPGGVAPPDAGEESQVAEVVTRLLVGLALVFVGAAAVLLLLMLRGWARDQR